MTADGGAAPTRTDMTVAEVRRYLRNWIAQATGQSPRWESARPRRCWSLACPRATRWRWPPTSRTTPGVTVSIAVAFEHPTIESLATWIVEGRPSRPNPPTTTPTGTRTGPVERVDIRRGGPGHPGLPGDLNTPEQTWQALLEGRDAITDLPEGRWSEFMEEAAAGPSGSRRPAPRGGYLTDIKGFDSEFLRAVQDRSRQYRPSAADDAGS